MEWGEGTLAAWDAHICKSYTHTDDLLHGFSSGEDDRDAIEGLDLLADMMEEGEASDARLTRCEAGPRDGVPREASRGAANGVAIEKRECSSRSRPSSVTVKKRRKVSGSTNGGGLRNGSACVEERSAREDNELEAMKGE